MKSEECSEVSYGPRSYRMWVLAMLCGVYLFYLLDRNALIVTQDLIKREFELSDTQLGLISGTIYALAYGIAGLPMGWLVDRVNRRKLLVSILAIWSGLTTLCGFASAFLHLLLIRLGVGAAESGGAPISLSILSDIYPPAKRGSVAGIFFAGSGIGAFISFLAGGFIAAQYGWRAVFLAYGIPGLILAGLLLFTLKDPGTNRHADNAQAPLGLARSLGAIARKPALVAIYAGSALFTLSMSGTGSWIMSFLLRVHHIDLRVGGTIIAVAFGPAGVVGAILIGFLSDRANKLVPGGALLTVAVVALINMSFGIAAELSHRLWIVTACIWVWGATANGYSGAANATISWLAPTGTRGVAFTLFTLVANMIGTGLGGFLVGCISDLAKGSVGDNSLRPALVSVALVQLATAALFVWGAGKLRVRI